ncbi:hypothetical protein ACFQ36_03325 [Arthrobacter sp. GCM10027362]|uniref:hypothetical protein n=1 Tax=Arthrobacter sp. GCM10027362 TaxID=3273379 RepID=UPI003633DA1E
MGSGPRFGGPEQQRQTVSPVLQDRPGGPRPRPLPARLPAGRSPWAALAAAALFWVWVGLGGLAAPAHPSLPAAAVSLYLAGALLASGVILTCAALASILARRSLPLRAGRREGTAEVSSPAAGTV